MSHRRQGSGKGKGKTKTYGRYEDDSSEDDGRQDEYGPPETDQGYQTTELHEYDDRPVKPDDQNYPSQGVIDPSRTRDPVHSYNIPGQPGFGRKAQRQWEAANKAGYPDLGRDWRGEDHEIDERGGDPEDDQHGDYPEDDQREGTSDYGDEEEEGQGQELVRYESPSGDEHGYDQPERTSSQNVEAAQDRDEDPYLLRRTDRSTDRHEWEQPRHSDKGKEKAALNQVVSADYVRAPSSCESSEILPREPREYSRDYIDVLHERSSELGLRSAHLHGGESSTPKIHHRKQGSGASDNWSNTSNHGAEHRRKFHDQYDTAYKREGKVLAWQQENYQAHEKVTETG